ncbi:MAG TPA: hypothetical protein VGB76_01725 [Pyrinomonadaceae bacterium]|jgi:hypothetical protein
MHRHRKILLLLVVLSVTALSALTALSGQEQTSAAAPTQHSAAEAPEPVADYAAGEPADPEKRAKRRARGKSYDGQSWVMEPHPQSRRQLLYVGAPLAACLLTLSVRARSEPPRSFKDEIEEVLV